MKREEFIYESKNQIEPFDQLVIKDSLNTKPIRIERIVEVTQSYFITENGRFNRHSFRSADKNTHTSYIDDVIYNVKRKSENYLKKQGFEFNSICYDDSALYCGKIGRATVDIFIYRKDGNKHKVRFKVGTVNLMFTTIETFDEFKTLFNCLKRHLL